MKLVFLSNFFNHHQKYVSNSLAEKCQYTFIETEKMDEERVKLGWSMESMPNYVKNYIEQKEECDKIIDDADVIVYGSAPYALLKSQIKKGKLILKYSERIYKKPLKWYIYPYRLLQNLVKFNKYSNIYLLCSSAYAAYDYAIAGAFKNKAYKWGYFPECKRYESIDTLIEQKQENSILWCARFIDWKHPEYAIEVAKRLKADGYSFKLKMIGVGPLYDEIAKQITALKLENEVQLLGSMKPEMVRQNMEESEIFIFTSDRQEGWGAVLNEAMNSGCAVVASNTIGAAPYLVENGANGLLYYKDSLDELYENVKNLLNNKEKRKEYSKSAYYTIVNEWNPENASKKLMQLINGLLDGKQSVVENGICSKA